MAHMTRRVLLNSMISGGLGMAMEAPAGETENAEARRRELFGLLGDLPPRQRPIGARTVSTEERPGYVLEKLVLDINGLEPVPAYFVKPKQLEGKAPAILFNRLLLPENTQRSLTINDSCMSSLIVLVIPYGGAVRAIVRAS